MQYNKHHFFKELVTFVFLSHLALLAIVFLCDSGKFTPERFVIHPAQVQSTIVFMPLKKRIEQKTVKLSRKQKKANKRKVLDYNNYEKKLAQQQKKQAVRAAVQPEKIEALQISPVIAPIVQPVVQSAGKKAATSVKSEVVKKPEIKKLEIKKPATKVVQKKVEIKKPVPIKQIKPVQKALSVKTPAAKEIKKVDDVKKNVVPAQQVIKPVVQPVQEVKPVKVQEVIAPVAVPEKEKSVIVEQTVLPEVLNQEQSIQIDESAGQDDNEHDDDLDLENVTFVGSHDLEMLAMQDEIKRQVGQHYKPPVGISKKAICELAVLVGPDGKAQRVTVKKGSGSMANDLCARAALLKITFPKKVFGKEIIVELGQ